DALLLVDTGPPPPAGHDRAGHAGMLAFEFGVGPARLVVNCGAYQGPDPMWRDAGRLTASHSTLVLGDRNSVEVEAGGGLRHRALETTADRQEDQGASWIAGSHDGYLRRFGVLHRRRVFLAADGGDLRGEDRLVPPPDKAVPQKAMHTPYAIRFHLHPDVFVGEPEPAANGSGALAVAFGCDESGPWELVAESGLAVSVEESFYLGRSGPPRKSHQIVLTGRIERETGAEARWAIKRLS
ncbi:MAG: heparinase II/III-family protein, partial [Rhodospirillaceae bacterium]|nr:heparinase II/III-family protein [Rhodospirillaceae bacterium]